MTWTAEEDQQTATESDTPDDPQPTTHSTPCDVIPTDTAAATHQTCDVTQNGTAATHDPCDVIHNGTEVTQGLEVMAQVKGDGLRSRKEDKSLKMAAAFEITGLPQELPSAVDIKKVLPKHCFESSLSRSTYFFLKDFACVAALYLMAEGAWHVLPSATQVVIAPVYWFLSGTFMWAIFVVGHEAGHGSFSKYEWVNDVAGNVAHGFLLIPYYMWKLSHRQHHKNTGNIDKDEIFYPVRRSDAPRNYDPKEENDPMYLPVFGLGFGWFYYLKYGYSPRRVPHFSLHQPMFSHHYTSCAISLAVVVLWAFCLVKYTLVFGVSYLLYHYLVPLFVFATYLVVVTFLHHNEPDTPWYSDQLWSYVRGQLSTVDRHYGWAHHITHNIGTHQIHHLFPKIPHYHLEEATAAFRSNFPALVRKSDAAILPAFWSVYKMFRAQFVIGDDQDLHVYRSRES